jgi:hypothetical protein
LGSLAWYLRGVEGVQARSSGIVGQACAGDRATHGSRLNNFCGDSIVGVELRRAL